MAYQITTLIIHKVPFYTFNNFKIELNPGVDVLNKLQSIPTNVL